MDKYEIVSPTDKQYKLEYELEREFIKRFNNNIREGRIFLQIQEIFPEFEGSPDFFNCIFPNPYEEEIEVFCFFVEPSHYSSEELEFLYNVGVLVHTFKINKLI